MKVVLAALLAFIRTGFQTRAALQPEVLALRHQLAVYPTAPAASPHPRH
jgi:hypothetical protein